MLENSQRQKSKSFTGFFFAAFSIFVWGITFVCTKSLLKDFSALEILIIRFLFAYAMLWILCPQPLRLERKKDEYLFAAAGLSGVAVYQFLENIAIMFSSASNVSVIVSICPIFAAITAQIFLHEKHVTPFFIAGFIIAISGVALVSFNGAAEFHLKPKGDLLALGSAVSWGFYTLFVTKINALRLNKLAAVRRIFFYALIFMAPLVLFGALSPLAKNNNNFFVSFDAAVNMVRFAKPLNWVNLLFLGVAASALCFAAWNTACDKLGAVRATVGIYLIPVVTIVFAYFALGERITVPGIAGVMLTICGLMLSNKKTRSQM
ncbi:DMT family transporter [Treponema socranskii]|uniref:DMT family transporter n=1 Tax=Treponema socranskii TaxID=53419 RepID=UPI003D6EE727